MADSSIGKAPTAPLNEKHIDESNASAIVAGLSILTAIMLIVVVLRIYVRLFVIKLMGGDDWWILGALACALGGYATFVAQSFYGLGRHSDVMTTLFPEKLVQFQRLQFAQTIISAIIGPCVLKISVALLLMRFVNKGWLVKALWIVMGTKSDRLKMESKDV